MVDEPQAIAAVQIALDEAELDITNSVAVMFLERSSGRTVKVKIVKRDAVMDWLRSNIEEWPPAVFRCILTALTPMVEMVSIADTAKPSFALETPPQVGELPN